jgi:hypothetical protein
MRPQSEPFSARPLVAGQPAGGDATCHRNGVELPSPGHEAESPR